MKFMLNQLNCLMLIDSLWSKMVIILPLAILPDMDLTHFFLFSCCLALLLLATKSDSPSLAFFIYIAFLQHARKMKCNMEPVIQNGFYKYILDNWLLLNTFSSDLFNISTVSICDSKLIIRVTRLRIRYHF